jgi:hypothetical protein
MAPEKRYRTNPGAYKAHTPIRWKDLQGRRFGKITAIFYFGKTVAGSRAWFCICDCGGSTVTSVSDLLQGKAMSCGCSRTEKLILRLTKHGQAGKNNRSKAYSSWSAMIARCTNPKSTKWAAYGGRGISIHERWFDFKEFFADMGPRPEGLTLDRIDVNGNYEKSNCRWADARTQASNKRIRVCRGKIYRARAWVNGRRLELGRFPLTPEGLQAAAKVIEEAKKLKEVFS